MIFLINCLPLSTVVLVAAVDYALRHLRVTALNATVVDSVGAAEILKWSMAETCFFVRSANSTGWEVYVFSPDDACNGG